MNPQHIVYLSLVLVGIGVTISAIDPLKPNPDSFGLYETDYYDRPIFVEAGNDYKIERIADDIYKFTAYPNTDWKKGLGEQEYIAWNTIEIPDSAVVTGIVCEDGSFERDTSKMTWEEPIGYVC